MGEISKTEVIFEIKKRVGCIKDEVLHDDSIYPEINGLLSFIERIEDLEIINE